MQSCSVKLACNILIHSITFTATLHYELLSIKKHLYVPTDLVNLH